MPYVTIFSIWFHNQAISSFYIQAWCNQYAIIFVPNISLPHKQTAFKTINISISYSYARTIWIHYKGMRWKSCFLDSSETQVWYKRCSLHLHKAIFSHYSPNFGNNSTAFSWEQTKFFKRIDLGVRTTVQCA